MICSTRPAERRARARTISCALVATAALWVGFVFADGEGDSPADDATGRMEGADTAEEAAARAPVTDPAELQRSGLRYSERDDIMDALAIDIERMLERIERGVPGDGSGPRVVLAGYADTAEARARRGQRAALDRAS